MMAEPVAIPTAAGTFDALAAGPEGGPATLLLHGFPECAEQWEHQLAALARAGYRAVAFDQRGYSPGVRPAGVGGYGPEEQIGDALAVADALGCPRFDLVGHDWGSAVAWMTAAAHPGRLRSLTAVSTPHGAVLVQALRDDPDQRRRSAYFELFRTPGEAERELLEEGGLRRLYDGLPAHRIERYLERFSEPGALTAALNWYRAMRPPAKRGPITTPTLYGLLRSPSEHEGALDWMGLAHMLGEPGAVPALSGAYDRKRPSVVETGATPEARPARRGNALLS